MLFYDCYYLNSFFYVYYSETNVLVNSSVFSIPINEETLFITADSDAYTQVSTRCHLTS